MDANFLYGGICEMHTHCLTRNIWIQANEIEINNMFWMVHRKLNMCSESDTSPAKEEAVDIAQGF